MPLPGREHDLIDEPLVVAYQRFHGADGPGLEVDERLVKHAQLAVIAGARLLWESLSTTKAVIPASQLFPVSQTTPPTGTSTAGATGGLTSRAVRTC